MKLPENLSVKQIVTFIMTAAGLLGALTTLKSCGEEWVMDWITGTEAWRELEARVDSLDTGHAHKVSEDNQRWLFHEKLPLDEVHRVDQ